MGILDDAIELVCWFESLPDCGTWDSDEKIAAKLRWFAGGHRSVHMPSAKARLKGGSGPDGDVARVRRARRYVDMNNEHQPFLGYSFGTKRNGAGRKFMMLITPNGANAPSAVDEAASEQMGRAVQQTNQAASERARMIHKLNEHEQAYIKANELAKAFLMHDAAKELQTFGQLSMTTLQTARQLGVLGQIGATA